MDKTHHAGQAPATRLLLVRLPLLLLGGVLLVLLFTRPADAAERRRSGLLDHAGRPAGRSGGHLPCSPDRTPAPPATRPAAPTTDAPTGRAAPRAAHGRDQAPAPLAAPLDLVRGSLGGLAGPLLPGGLGGMVGPVLPGGLLRVELPLPRVPLRPLVAYSTPRAGPVGDLLPAPTSASTGPALLVPPPGAGARRRWRAPPCRPAAPRDPHLWRCQARPALPGLRRAAGTLLGARRRPASGWPSWPTRCSCSACGARGAPPPNGRVPAPAPASPSSLRPDGFDVLERPGPHPIPVPARLSPIERVRAEIDDLFATDQPLGEVLEHVARASVRLVLQAALEAEVTEFLGRDRYQHASDPEAAGARPGYRNGHEPLTIKTTTGPVTLQRPSCAGPTRCSRQGCWARA